MNLLFIIILLFDIIVDLYYVENICDIIADLSYVEDILILLMIYIMLKIQLILLEDINELFNGDLC